MPDHRVISVDVALNSLLPHNLKGCNPYTKGTSADETKIKIKTMPENYLLDPTIIDRLEALAAELDENTHTTSEISCLNKVYEEFCTIIDSQLKSKLIRSKGKRKGNIAKE